MNDMREQIMSIFSDDTWVIDDHKDWLDSIEALIQEQVIAELEKNKWLPDEAKWIEQEAERIAKLKGTKE